MAAIASAKKPRRRSRTPFCRQGSHLTYPNLNRDYGRITDAIPPLPTRKPIEIYGPKAGPFREKMPGPVSIEAGRQLSLAEDDRRLVVIVAHLGIAGG